MAVVGLRPAARGSEERINELRRGRVANQVGSIADGAVRALLRVRRGDDASRGDPALEKARLFIAGLAEQPESGAYRDPLRVSRLMAWATEEPDPSHGATDPGQSDGAAEDLLREFAEKLETVIRAPTGHPELTAELLRRFDSLADATLVLAADSAPPRARSSRWSRT